MNTNLFKEIFTRDLGKLKTEIESYRDESAIWRIDGEIKNSAGNLCLHLVGNLKTYIGATLGQSGYIRHREQEFQLKDVPRAELVRMIEETIAAVQAALDHLPSAQLAEEYPLVVFEAKTTTGFMLVHLVAHLGYHLGQINYHRRLLDR
ncbi:MAG TPA: DinB family protein [Flavisolibacter sp.]|nr:DinB family protein [Flavisolibacter sp.]